MNTKLFNCLMFIFVLSMGPNLVLAQPGFKDVSNQIIVAKRPDSNTSQSLVVYWKGTNVKTSKAILKFEKIMGKEVKAIMNPLAAKTFNFGTDLSNEYPIKLDFLKNIDSTETDIVRLTLVDATDTTKMFDTLLVFYQQVKKTPKDQASYFTEPIKQMRNEIEKLQHFVLYGDTSKADLGKFVMKDSLISISAPNKLRDELNYKFKKFYQYDLLKSNYSKIFGQLKSKINESKTIPTKVKGLDFRRFHRYNPDKPVGNDESITVDIDYRLKIIKDVRFKVSEGFIEYLRVRTSDNNVFVHNKPISVAAFDTHLDKKIFSENDGQFIFLGDVLNLDTDRFFNYLPDDTTYNLSASDKEREGKLIARSGLAALVDLRIYTDLLGTFGEQANGLVQIEATSKLPLTSVTHNRSLWFNFIQPFFKLSKLDSKYDTIAIKTDANGMKINKMELFQRSFLNLGLKANIYKVNWRPNNGIAINIGYGFSSGNVSVGKDSISKANLHMPYAEFAYSNKKLENFGFDGEIRYGFQKSTKNKYLDASGWDNLMSISTSMFFYPKSRTQDKFFVRFVDYISFKDRASDFYQLQIGYSINLRLGQSGIK